MTSDNLIITVSGHPASGTTTLVEQLSDELNIDVMSGGDIFRKMARERGIKPYELSELAETDETIDFEVDQRVEEAITEAAKSNETLIVESRLAGWHGNGKADLSVWLTAPRDVRFKRLDDRAETKQELRRREESDSKRYKDLYDIDIDDMSPYDLVIDTESLSANHVASTVIATARSVSDLHTNKTTHR